MHAQIVTESQVPTFLFAAGHTNVDVVAVRPGVRLTEVRIDQIEVAQVDVVIPQRG